MSWPSNKRKSWDVVVFSDVHVSPTDPNKEEETASIKERDSEKNTNSEATAVGDLTCQLVDPDAHNKFEFETQSFQDFETASLTSNKTGASLNVPGTGETEVLSHTTPKIDDEHGLKEEETASIEGKDSEKKTKRQENYKATAVRDFTYYLEDPDALNEFGFETFSRENIETASLTSIESGASLIFPRPGETEVLSHTPAKPESYIKIEDTFWTEKKKLVPEYTVMERIDEHVLEAKDSLKSDPAKLVEYLIKPCKDQVQKARAIIRWIGENVQYDTDFLRTGVRGGQTVEEVLRTGRAVCNGYGTVFSHLGSLAGLECMKIGGQAKGAGYYPGCFDPERLSNGPGAHAWNAVKLNGQWFLSDATWAAGSTESGTYTFNKKWKEIWFLSEPTYFVLTHVPLNGDVIQADEQHLEKPITDPKVWAELALTTPQAGVYGVRPLSHKNSVIETSTGEVVIKYTCAFPLKQFVSVEKIEKGGKVTGPEIKQMVALFTLEGESVIMARFQAEGSYDIEVCGGIENGHPVLNVNTKLLAYRVKVSKKSIMKPLPVGLDDTWGIEPAFLAAGYKVKYPKTCIIKTTDGIAMIRITLPSRGLLPNMFKLAFSDGKGATGNFDDYVIAGRRGDSAIYCAQCPEVGEYKLQVYAKYDQNTKGLYVGAAFLILCSSPAKDPIKVDSNRSFLGIDEHFLMMGLVTSAQTTILKVKHGQARLRIKKTQPAKLLVKLHAGELEMKDGVEVSESGDGVTIEIKPPRPGFYVLTLYATEPSSNNYPFAGRFGVSYDSKI